MTKKIDSVIGLAGKYIRAKKKNGKHTAVTAARPNGFPFPDPVEIYLSNCIQLRGATERRDTLDIPHDSSYYATEEGGNDSRRPSKCRITSEPTDR